MKSILIALILAVPAALHAQTTVTGNLKYLGQPGPGTAPVKFAPGLVSQDSVHEFGSVFSSDGNEFYYGVDVEGRTEIRFMSIVKGQWTKPERLLFHNQYSYNDPMLSPDEKRLYFISDQPLESSDGKKDYDIWYVDRIHDGWSSPRNAGPSINSNGNEYYMSFSNYGTMYFSSNKASKDGKWNYDIWAAKHDGNNFQPSLPLDEGVNTAYYEADVFVAPDESYLIFCGDRPGGFGKGDLYISFRNQDGSWTKARNMGEAINTPGHELCPFVTRDGKYFFYTSNMDIYWVDASILETMR